jgi:predicted CopG family antitoxin
MKTLHITLPDDTLFQKLEAIAREQRLSVEEVVRKLLLKFAAGSRIESPKRDKNDVIDEMAGNLKKTDKNTVLEATRGTWSQEEAEEFERNTAQFREIDPEMWK